MVKSILLDLWKGRDFLENIIIVSNVQKNISYFEFMLKSIDAKNVSVVFSCKEAREIMLNKPIDLVIVDSPLKDELGRNFSIDAGKNDTTQVLYCVDKNDYAKSYEELLKYGVITIEKPFDRILIKKYLDSFSINNKKLRKMTKENKKLSDKIENIKTIDRAKYILISYLNMTEKEAHKYIEKQAMDTRVSKIEIAINILKTYES